MSPRFLYRRYDSAGPEVGLHRPECLFSLFFFSADFFLLVFRCRAAGIVRVRKGRSFSRSGLADRLMSVSGEILMFLFRQGRVKQWKIGDVQGGGV